MSSGTLDEALKQQLSARLFANADESVLAALRVTKDEDKRMSTGGAPQGGGSSLQRVLIVTVKKSGKTRLHKAKQLSNGSFSIGKTWLLDDVRAIEIVDLCRKRPPRLINFDERLLKDSKVTIESEGAVQQRPTSDPSAANAGDKLKRRQYAENELINTDELLKNFDWKVMHDASALEGKLQKELATLESTNLRAMLETTKSTNLVVAQIDKTLEKLDGINAWLAMYTDQLLDMAKEAATIESKNTALHIQTENQEALQNELEKILDSLTLPEVVIQILQNESLDSGTGVQRFEGAANVLRQALTSTSADDAKSLRFVQERMADLKFHSATSTKRFCDFIAQALQHQADTALADKSRLPRKGQLKLVGREGLQDYFAKYRNLLAWLREVDSERHVVLQKQYAQAINKIVRKDTKEYFEVLRTQCLAKAPSTDEQDYLFTAVSTLSNIPSSLARAGISSSKFALNQTGLSASNAHLSRPTPNRQDNPSRLGNNGLSNSIMGLELVGSDKLTSHEALSSTMEIFVPTVVREQNYFTELFGLVPEQNAGGGRSWQDRLDTPQHARMAADTETSVRETMEQIMEPLPAELMALIEIGLKGDPTTSIGFLATVEKRSEAILGSNLSYLKALFDALDKRLIAAWEKLLNEQSRAIQESKVTTKKRTGVLHTVKVFVKFVSRIEDLVVGAKGRCRAMVDQGYQRLVSLVFESLDSIAHEASQNADDKEQINIHIVMMENMNFFRVELRSISVPSLDENMAFAQTSYEYHLSSYIKKVIKKPLSKLIEFFDGIDNLLRTGTPEEVGFHMNYNKTAAKRIVGQYPLKEVRKAIDAVYKRVEKHLSGEQQLFDPVWRRTTSELVATRQWMAKLLTQCYADAGLQLEFDDSDVIAICNDMLSK
ncbi:hypothetical protein RI367_000352 [Sorochytrium milnesiophthora]